MLPIELAIVPETNQVSVRDLTRVAAALQKQISRDFSPIWRIPATLDAFVQLEDVPLGYWPIVIADNINQPGAAGIHLDKDGQPFALVQVSNTWALTASHECLEMLADPFGNLLRAGPSIKPDQGRVEYLVEVCDPSEAMEFGYDVNGIRVSDFYTPHFFEPVSAAGVRYSFTGAITTPRKVLKGGYLSWHEPITDHWWQQIFFGSGPQFKDLGIFQAHAENLRATIDKLTPFVDIAPELTKGLDEADARIVSANSLVAAVGSSSDSRAGSLRSQIDRLRGAG